MRLGQVSAEFKKKQLLLEGLSKQFKQAFAQGRFEQAHMALRLAPTVLTTLDALAHARARALACGAAPAVLCRLCANWSGLVPATSGVPPWFAPKK